VRQYYALKAKVADSYLTKLIIVNDGSTLSIEKGIRLIKDRIPEFIYKSYDLNKGKGSALRTGVAASSAEVIMYTDHDLPYTYGSMKEMLDVLDRENADVVIGHRGEKYYKDLPWLRIKISHYLKTTNRFLLGLNTDDTQCGVKVFKDSVRSIFLETKTKRFLIDIEFLKRLKKAGKSVEVIDVKSRDNVLMSTLGFRTILSELWSYFKILFFV